MNIFEKIIIVILNNMFIMKKTIPLIIIICIFKTLCANAQAFDSSSALPNYSFYNATKTISIDPKGANSQNLNKSPSPKVVFTSSNLPIIVINTNNVTVPDTPKIAAFMGVIYHGPGIRNYMTDPFNNYNNRIGIELRGSTSQDFPQKPYSIETRDTSGEEHDTIVLEMPEENAWILYAPYNDKSCMRNTLVYDLANKTGHYAARTKFCELVLNGTYQGIYVWMEKIKHDANRVNIAKMESTDTVGDALTGGYIFKIDKTTGSGGSDGWNSTFQTAASHTVRFLYDYPAFDEIVVPQENYIKAYVDSFEVALNSSYFANPVTGYRKYIDVGSFIDYFILNELTRNVDSYRLSTFLYKNRESEGRKIVCGPAWDYNIALGNANYNHGSYTSGWAYVDNESYTGDVPFWWARFMQDTSFTSNLKCRWNELRQGVFSNASINAYIDTTKAYLNEAQARHFVQWPILGVYTWPNPSPYPSSYSGEITALKTWITNRLTWMDANMPGFNNLPIINLGNDTTACPGQFVLNAGNPGSTYLWNTNDTSQAITVSDAGIYNVLVNKNGCKKTDSISINILPLPTALVGNDTSICQGSSIALFASGGVSYVWNNSVLQGVPFIPISSQYYVVTVNGANGCTNKDSIEVSLITLPAKPQITVVYSAIDTLKSNIAIGNQWYKDGNILLGENGPKLMVSSLVTGNYTDIVTENGCASDPSDVVSLYAGIAQNNNDFTFSAFPNPFAAQTNFSFTLKASKHIFISIYDVTGRLISILCNSMQEKGEHNIHFDAAKLHSGVYYYNIKVGEDAFTGKIIKLD